MIHIIETAHFEDVDHDAGYEYIGDDYTIQAENQIFLVRKYCGECRVYIIRPKRFDWQLPVAASLFEYLKENLSVSKIEVYVPELGYYQPVDIP